MSFATHSPTRTHAIPSSPDPSINREVAGAIASLLRLIRPAWDQLTTLNAVREASRTHRDLADLVAGCVRIAEDRSFTAPTIHAKDGLPHWRRTATPTITSPPANESCPVRGHDGYWSGNCPACRLEALEAAALAAREERIHPHDRYGVDR